MSKTICCEQEVNREDYPAVSKYIIDDLFSQAIKQIKKNNLFQYSVIFDEQKNCYRCVLWLKLDDNNVEK